MNSTVTESPAPLRLRVREGTARKAPFVLVSRPARGSADLTYSHMGMYK